MNLSNIKHRVLYYVDFKGIKKIDFFKEINVTSASFRGKPLDQALNSNSIERIVTSYPDVNLSWLITGKGEMLLENTNSPTNPLKGVLVDKFDISPEAELQNSEFKNAEENVEWYRKLVEIQQKTIDEGIVLQKDMMAQLNGNRLTIEKLIAIIKKNQDKQINNDIG